MSRQRQFGKDLTNTKGLNAPGPSNQYLEELKTATKKNLKKDEAICPICYSVILEPVTFPCNHNVCRHCFDIHIWETSIYCPCCRRRLSVWCRKAVKENSIVNLKLKKQIENQFPLQVAAQKEKLELPEEERKLDHVLVEFLADDSPRLPPRQFAKTGEIAKEFNEMLSKHLEDLQRAEESATEDFIAKSLTREEQQAIRNLEENLMLGEGFKEKNEECLGLGAKHFIKLRARPVQAANLKSSLDASQTKKTKLEDTRDSLMSPEPSVLPKIQPSRSSISTNQAGEEQAQDLQHQTQVSPDQLLAPCIKAFNETLSKPLQDLYQTGKSTWDAFIAKRVSPKEQEAIRKLEKNLKLGKGLREKNEECLGVGANCIKLRARPVQAMDLKTSPDISKPKITQLKPTSDCLMLPEPSVSPQIQPNTSQVCTNQAGEQAAKVFPRKIKLPRRQFKIPDEQFNDIDIYKMLCMFAGSPAEPLNKIPPKKTPIRARQDGAESVQVFPCQTKVPRGQFNTTSDPLKQADLYTTKRGHLGSAYQVLQDHNYFMPAAPSSSSATKPR